MTDDAQSAAEETQKPRRRRGWGERLLRLTLWLITIGAALGILWALLGIMYRGPKQMEQVVAVMPGVPIFPMAQISPGNDRTQRLMAIPLWLIRVQGATEAQTVLLQAPGDADFIADWMADNAKSQNWKPRGEWTLSTGGKQMLFQRDREGLQIIIGQSQDGLSAPLQLTYMDGLTEKQLRDLR